MGERRRKEGVVVVDDVLSASSTSPLRRWRGRTSFSIEILYNAALCYLFI